MKKIQLQIVVFKFLSIFLFMVPLNSSAQSWQWLKSGGNNDSGSGFDFSEDVQIMESDPQGNVYMAFETTVSSSITSPSIFSISGIQVARYTNRDAIIASFDCEGNLRWTNAIGGDYTLTPGGATLSIQVAYIKSLKTDAQGNVYATGYLQRDGVLPSQPLHFSPNFTVPNSPEPNVNKQSFFIVKYNTDGIAQWVRFPEAPNVSVNSNIGRAFCLEMDVDPSGTVHIYSVFFPGVFCEGNLIQTNPIDTNIAGILKYDTNGNFLGNIPIQYKGDDIYPYHFIHDFNLDRYLFAQNSFQPEQPIIIGGQVQEKSMFVACFNSFGALLWKKEDISSLNEISGWDAVWNGLSIDNESNIYFNCKLGKLTDRVTGEPLGTNGWDGQLLPTPEGWVSEGLPTVIKMDANGNTLWIKAKNTDTFASNSIFNESIISGNELVISLGFKGMSWEGIPEITNDVNGSVPGILRLNKNTGVGIGLHYLKAGNGSQVPAGEIAAGPNGSYYLSGGFETTLSLNLDGSNPVITTGGYDDFFIAKFGTSNCTLATNDVKNKVNTKLYPNPVASLLYLNNKEIVNYIIYDSLGKKMQMGALEPNSGIDLQFLNKGIYLVQVKDEVGTITTEKIMKE